MITNKVKEDLQSALKNRESLKVSTLRLLLSSIQSEEKNKRYKSSSQEDVFLTDDEVIGIIQSEVKKRRESIKGFIAGKREDLAEKETREISILENYLPEKISEAELEEIVKKSINQVKAKDMRDMGKVMAMVLSETKGRAEGKEISEKVKNFLSSK